MDDRMAGQMIGKGGHPFEFFVWQNHSENESLIDLRFTVNIDVKDGKNRYRIYDFTGQDLRNGHLLNFEEQYKTLQLLTAPVAPQAKRENDKERRLREMATEYGSKLISGLDIRVHGLIESLKDAMAKAESSDW